MLDLDATDQQIIAFLQNALNQPIILTKPVGLNRKAEVVHMPGESNLNIETYIRKKL